MSRRNNFAGYTCPEKDRPQFGTINQVEMYSSFNPWKMRHVLSTSRTKSLLSDAYDQLGRGDFKLFANPVSPLAYTPFSQRRSSAANCYIDSAKDETSVRHQDNQR